MTDTLYLIVISFALSLGFLWLFYLWTKAYLRDRKEKRDWQKYLEENQ